MTEQTTLVEATPEQATPPTPTPKKKRRRRLGDRKDGRKLRTVPAMTKFMPYIMARRSDACNTFSDSLEIAAADSYCRQKVREGLTGFSMDELKALHAAGKKVMEGQKMG